MKKNKSFSVSFDENFRMSERAAGRYTEKEKRDLERIFKATQKRIKKARSR